jgi:4-hydroxy-3-polyprenylbenzoate decarboxylase/2,5-furandicarboxylate decarboxylase 1
MLKDMRSFLDLLEANGDLVHIRERVAPRYGVSAGIRKTSNIDGPALWFDNVLDSAMPVVGGLYSARRRCLWGLEATEDTIRERFAAAVDHPIPPRLAKDGPCKEVVLMGDDARIDRLPNCVYSAEDAGPYITLGLLIARHPQGRSNVGIYRMQVFDGKHLGVNSAKLDTYTAAAEARGEPVGVALTLGNDPYTTLASQYRGRADLDELAVAGGMMGEAIEVVPCETVDVVVPATSEIVFEGEILPGERWSEGPFGEAPGYYSPAGPRPVFRLKAITHRRNPIYLAGLTGVPATDNHVMKQVVTEPLVYHCLRQICPTVRDVCCTTASHSLHFVISMRPTSATQAQEVMRAALTSEFQPKLVTIVDEDIDVRDPAQVEWAMTFRFQADRGVEILPHVAGYAMDPSIPRGAKGSRMGINATRPYDDDYGNVVSVPGADEFVIPGWTDVAAKPAASR